MLVAARAAAAPSRREQVSSPGVPVSEPLARLARECLALGATLLRSRRSKGSATCSRRQRPFLEGDFGFFALNWCRKRRKSETPEGPRLPAGGGLFGALSVARSELELCCGNLVYSHRLVPWGRKRIIYYEELK